MPPQLQALLQNRRLLAIIGGVLLIMLVMLIWHPWATTENDPGKMKLEENQRKLASVDSVGKAIEIQALLARESIHVDREDGDGGKVNVFLDSSASFNDRDRAVITLVQSGLMDRNVGLEAFDKGDLTASREEKRIKLIRAQQGELSRLVRKIPPVQDATVSLSIPEATIFKSDQKPMSASVQVVLPNGERLTRDKVRSIINLLVGSVQGLDAQHVALSDTNGNTYNSVLDLGSELNDKLEEQDQYMKQKVSAQLDKLVGAGNYVVTVSTFLRETSKETMVQQFDPEQSVISSRQNFSERLNNAGSRGAGGPVTTVMPSGVDATSSSGSSGKGYSRVGTEVSYANSKTQWVEMSMPGMIEDISIAVTVDRSHFPDIDLGMLRKLLANAASPKVDPINVSVATVDFHQPGGLNDTNGLDTASSENTQNMDWIVWAVVSGGVIVIIAVFALLFSNRIPKAGDNTEQFQQTQQEIQRLKEFTTQQQAQLNAAQQQAQRLMEAQQKQLVQTVPGEARREEISPQAQLAELNEMKQTLSALKKSVTEEQNEDEDLDLQIKSWIESS